MPRVMVTCPIHGWSDGHVDDPSAPLSCGICNAPLEVKVIDELTQIVCAVPFTELARQDAAQVEQPKILSTFTNAQGDTWGVVDTGDVEHPTFVLLKKA